MWCAGTFFLTNGELDVSFLLIAPFTFEFAGTWSLLLKGKVGLGPSFFKSSQVKTGKICLLTWKCIDCHSHSIVVQVQGQEPGCREVGHLLGGERGQVQDFARLM